MSQNLRQINDFSKVNTLNKFIIFAPEILGKIMILDQEIVETNTR